MKHTRKKSNVMKKHVLILPVFLVAVVALMLGATVTEGWAAPFDEAEIFFECNDTDGDCGLHAFSDAEGVLELEISDPDGEPIFEKSVSGNLEEHGGLSEEFFESVEPELEDGQDFIDFLELFPAGQYRFSANEGGLRSNARLSHTIPCGPEVPTVTTKVDGVWVDLDVVEDEVDGEVNPDFDLTINWEAVTEKYDTNPDPGGDPLDCTAAPGMNIVNVEFVLEEDRTGKKVLIANLPGDALSVTVPAAFLEPGTDYKFEVIVKEATGNQTITEVAFSTSN